jgi:hypothetical protein
MDTGIDLSEWAASHDVRLPETEPSRAESIAACKANYLEAVGRWRHATRWARRLVDENPDAPLKERAKNEPEVVEALTKQARAKADAQHWAGVAAFHEAELAMETQIATIAAVQRGDRVPGEDDGEE